jgi:hypothetical protein
MCNSLREVLLCYQKKKKKDKSWTYLVRLIIFTIYFSEVGFGRQVSSQFLSHVCMYLFYRWIFDWSLFFSFFFLGVGLSKKEMSR